MDLIKPMNMHFLLCLLKKEIDKTAGFYSDWLCVLYDRS